MIRFGKNRCKSLLGLLAIFALIIPLYPTMALASIASPGGWEWQNPLPQGNSLYGIWGSAANDVFTVGEGGTILHYDGISWSAQSSGTTKDLNAVWGSSAANVFAVGNGGTIIRYNGIEWTSQSSGTSVDLYGIWGISESSMFAVGSGGTILHYNGTSWSSQASGSTNRLYGVWGTDTSNMYAVGEGGTILFSICSAAERIFAGSGPSLSAKGIRCGGSGAALDL